MNVACAVFDRLHDDEVGELDDGRFLRRGGQLVEVHILGHFAGDLQTVGLGVGVGFFLRLALGMLDDVLHRAAAPIQIVELVENGLLRGDHRHDFQLGAALDVVEGQHVERVGHREEQLVVQARDRQHFVIGGHFTRHQTGHLLRDTDAAEVDRRDVEDAAHRDDHVQFADVGFFEDQLEQAGAFLFLQFEQFLDLLDGEQPVFDQSVGDAFSKTFNWRHRRTIS